MKQPPEPLPHAPIRMVLGLVEHLHEAPGGREDLYKLGGPLGYELDDLLPVTEAAKRLQLVVIESGDIELTADGRALAAAEEPERKRLIAGKVCALPLVAEIRKAVEKKGHAPRRGFAKRLHDHFSEGEAERQLSTALNWARYGELFDFDSESEEFVPAPTE
jgi:NitT/TauT family transport system ATP-binding protein